ncbi:DMT family transporter [Paenibacillus wynnii]|uniref:Multidrug resistance protein SMR n=1 Tax=Paenibacillus wynnii TaxID=268407 RepID=A0A098M9G0_9BACL|nr:SMR family transporter [Paenibacillus wynnii]KGE18688.1 multidrug resistance protein SMR [Paenibacillus wynnii]
MNNNLSWAKVFGAAFFEVVWVIGLKHASTFLEWAVTIIAILISFYVLISAGRKLPVGTVYSVFVGLGTAGTFLAEIILFDKPFNLIKLALVLVLLTGVVGLKQVTMEKSVS